MGMGFIRMTKKGQDLARPGEKDDLRQIIDQRRDDVRKHRERVAEARDEAASSR
jgi:hypothetical protein